jgi:ATPase subunit of ABC transporter with duplicated ATPase domains
MVLSVEISEKSFGSNLLYSDVRVEIQEGEKVGLIGRNGTGKTTLFHILTGEDTDYQGQLNVRRGVQVISSRQEHHGLEAKTVMEYILGELPEHEELTHIIDTYPQTMGSDQAKMQKFSDALERFNDLAYYEIESEIEQAFDRYQIDKAHMHHKLGQLSGGQKRMVELIKMQRSRADLTLIDEPTNHMDYVAKQTFINWLRATKEAALVITHDRDVLNSVERIIEIRDGLSYSYKGNYSAYLRTNKSKVTSEVSAYDQTQKRITTLQDDVRRFQRMKEKARDPGTIRRFKSQEQQAREELSKLLDVEKPSFWIDQDTASEMNQKMTSQYSKYKATNIKVQTRKKNHESNGRSLIRADKLSLGYDGAPLFSDISFILSEGERIRLHGRNGAGKTTIVQAVMAAAQQTDIQSQLLSGELDAEKELKIGLYEQSIDPAFLDMNLEDAIEHIYRQRDLPINPQNTKRLLSDYLFEPNSEGKTPVHLLSGGQKARLQIISMLAGDPHILILDEPTNHLDLPSIEELENALLQYHGAVMYVSHDSFFADKLGGETIYLNG